MAFYDRLKEGRVNAGFTQEQLAEKLGVAKSTLSGYESGNREPTVATIAKALEILNIDANFLYQDEMDALGGNPMKLKYEEMEHIRKYRDLDDYGREIISYLLDGELHRVNQLKEMQKDIEQPTGRIIEYYQRLASAGNGQVIFEDMPIDRITIPELPEYKRVSYAIGVNGNSMEPSYHDGDVLLVEPTCDIDVGEIGIFIVGNEAYVKKLGEDKLISLNKEYGDIAITEYSKCMGRVIGAISNFPQLGKADIEALKKGYAYKEAHKSEEKEA